MCRWFWQADHVKYVTATVDGVASGRVSVNNDFQSLISTSATYNESSNSTQITIQGKSETEGYVPLVLRSYEGNGQKVIYVYVYSDIKDISQSENTSDQYIVKGEPTVLDSDRFLQFTSRDGGESNRKQVDWSLISIDEHTTLQDGVLTVGDDSQLTSVIVRAQSVYKPEIYEDITLTVISALPEVRLEFSRDLNAFNQTITEEDMDHYRRQQEVSKLINDCKIIVLDFRNKFAKIFQKINDQQTNLLINEVTSEEDIFKLKAFLNLMSYQRKDLGKENELIELGKSFEAVIECKAVDILDKIGFNKVIFNNKKGYFDAELKKGK